ncbi:hypothetical protein [Microbacterium sp. SORGH_AS_0888]|uniref:hypothetical protein n=1 Tax=Microbacterium sp. SORGH_AS_0888 TaxID=3041791 RepID=UPI002784B07D|nr:hypothetical protein [Microbacterium sp. SORGH_AS_0888]MDQ1128984.1 hypothetical protein [Microbacterium sp. SORGH_AS_0888]
MTDPTPPTAHPADLDSRDPGTDRPLDEDREADTSEHTPEGDPERASPFATRGDPSTTTTADAPEGPQPAGVRWVRPTDLAAQAGAAVLARGAAANTQLHDAVADGLRELRANLADRLAHRQTHLEPEATTTGPTTRERPLARTGVSR